MSWTTVGVDGCARWGIVSSVTTTVDEGVDFIYRARAQYPMRACEDRPIVATTVLPEGRP